MNKIKRNPSDMRQRKMRAFLFIRLLSLICTIDAVERGVQLVVEEDSPGGFLPDMGGLTSPNKNETNLYGVNCQNICKKVHNSSIEASDCSDDCKQKKCLTGCSLWVESTNSSCQHLCGSLSDMVRGSAQDLYCTLGCFYSTQEYYGAMRGKIGNISVPYARNTSNSSVLLKWEEFDGKDKEPYLPIQYMVQFREALSEWQYYPVIGEPITDQETVENLKPYTKYQFRVVLFVVPTLPPFYSEHSSWISTKPYGPPLSPPQEVEVKALDGSRIEVKWEKPLYPSDEIVSYTIYLKDSQEELRKDVAVKKERRFIFSGLAGNSSYEVKVTAVNKAGEGPAAIRNVTTYPGSDENGMGGYLLLASDASLLKLELDIMKSPVYLYNASANVNITGLALHIRLGMLYVSDTTGNILQLIPAAKKKRTLNLKLKGGKPTTLSVDWLNGYLYILEEPLDDSYLTPSGGNQTLLESGTSLERSGKVTEEKKRYWNIWRTNLVGENVRLVIGDVPYRPNHLQIDPYNGYLWWIKATEGLYRFTPGGRSKDILSAKLIYQDDNLGGFACDPPNFRVLVVSRGKNSMLMVSLDGSMVGNARLNTQQAYFNDTKAVVLLHGRFYWTNGKEVFTEEYNDGVFYHNSYAMINRSTGPLVGVHPSVQPLPLPLSPPHNLEVFFTTSTASIHWEKPVSPPLMGPNGWKGWNYELHIQNGPRTIYHRGLNETTFLAKNLQPDTFYVIKVRAHSQAGVGPWSIHFRGNTLESGSSGSKLVVISKQFGITSSPITGEDSTILAPNFMEDYFPYSNITSVAFYRDLLLLCSQHFPIAVFNTSSRTTTRLPHTEGVMSVSVDWITGRVFWSKPYQHEVGWRSLTSDNHGTLGLMTGAMELAVDSLRGTLYWTTRHGVHSSTLMGRNELTHHQEDIFTGRTVHSLVLDVNGGRIWWVVRGLEKDYLNWGKVRGDNSVIKMGEPLPFKHFRTSISSFFSDRLLLVEKDRTGGRKRLVISDTSLNSSATLPFTHFHRVVVVDESLQPRRDWSLEVFPVAVDASSIRTRGSWRSFRIEWGEITNINLGVVEYDITLTVDETHRYNLLSNTSSIVSPWAASHPYQPMQLSVRGFTRWGAGPRTLVTIHSPQSTPDQPKNLRFFVEKETRKVPTIYLRWDVPGSPNGVILNYTIETCVGGGSDCSEITVGGETLQHVVEGVTRDFKFRVAASTIIGKGPYSSNTTVATSFHKPVPRLVSSSGSELQILDSDLRTLVHLKKSRSGGIFLVDVLLKNGSLVTLEDGFDINIMDWKRNETKNILKLGRKGVALSVDWISERILWMDETPSSSFTPQRLIAPNPYESFSHSTIPYHFFRKVYGINAFDLNFGSHKLLSTFELNGTVKEMVFSPTKIIFLVMNQHGKYEIFTSKHFGPDVKPLFRFERSANRTGCSCPENPSLSRGLTFDSSSKKIIFSTVSDYILGTGIVSSDLQGCKCRTLAMLDRESKGCSSITSDSSHLYCYTSQDKLQTYSKQPSDKFLEYSLFNGWMMNDSHSSLHALDKAIQPIPSPLCLIPSTPATIQIESVGPVSAVLKIIPPNNNMNEECRNLLPLSYQYTLHYAMDRLLSDGTCEENPDLCSVKVTTEDTVTLVGLAPFSSYKVQVSTQTIYNVRSSQYPMYGSMNTFHTRAEAPPVASGLSVHGLTPESLKVTFNTEKGIAYKVFWRFNDTLEGSIRSPKNREVDTNETVNVEIGNLEPNTRYKVWVRVLSPHDSSVYVDSSSVTNITLPRLSPIQLLNSSSTSLTVAWTAPSDDSISRHSLDYRNSENTTWRSLPFDQSSKGQRSIYEVQHLKPGRNYFFRMNVVYGGPDFVKYSYSTGENDKGFNFTTLSSVPGAPGKVRLQQIGGAGEGWQAWWGEADSNGSPVETYELEASDLSPEGEDGRNYTLLYIGEANFWDIEDLDVANSVHMFRVRAVNSVGVGPYSPSSTLEGVVGASLLTTANLSTVLAATIPACLVMVLVLFSLLTCVARKVDSWGSKSKGGSSSAIHSSRELELSSMHQMPNNNNFVTEENIIYNMQTFNDEIELPRVSQHCISRTKFLGSGAFGEVFEGIASGIPTVETGGTVAVKMLRKGSTETEKKEFLKEAQLMSRFHHKHILRLLAICTDYDPFFLVLEMMEGGDLLSYLRLNRTNHGSPGFALDDLSAMCVDVAKGCQYLEEMHFVHRDLAARNCLVTSTDPANRIVKIGDFGLARDIYKNDYYRKHGEGKLPVRWMSPESLIDGVFTTQSDVWSFGVLLWEIMTLGQQPYPGMNHQEVMTFVRTGGRLTPPSSTPPEIKDLMCHCWAYSPARRPPFRDTLTVLLKIQAELEKRVTAVHNANYMTQPGTYGLDNPAYSSEATVSRYFEVDSSMMDDSTTHLHNLSEVSDLQAIDDTSFDMFEGCDSGASTIPLSTPFKNGQYFPLVQDSATSPTSPKPIGLYSKDQNGQRPTSEVCTEISMLSTTPTFSSEAYPSTSAASTRRKSLDAVDRRLARTSSPTYFRPLACPSYCSPIQSPSPFLLSFFNNDYPDGGFRRSSSMRVPGTDPLMSVPDSPTSVSFTFPSIDSNHHHYVSPNKCFATRSVLPTPANTPDTLVEEEPKFSTNGGAVANSNYVNQVVLNCYTPPESNKSSPENANTLTHDGFLVPKRSSSYGSLAEDSHSGCYLDMSPNKTSSNNFLRPPKKRKSDSSLNTLNLTKEKTSADRSLRLELPPTHSHC